MIRTLFISKSIALNLVSPYPRITIWNENCRSDAYQQHKHNLFSSFQGQYGVVSCKIFVCCQLRTIFCFKLCNTKNNFGKNNILLLQVLRLY